MCADAWSPTAKPPSMVSILTRLSLRVLNKRHQLRPKRIKRNVVVRLKGCTNRIGLVTTAAAPDRGGVLPLRGWHPPLTEKTRSPHEGFDFPSPSKYALWMWIRVEVGIGFVGGKGRTFIIHIIE